MTKLGEMRDLVGIYFRPNFSSPVASRDFVYNFKGFGGDEGDRTPYLNAASVALYQMSYVPMCSNFAVQEFPADKFQFKKSDLGKFYQGLDTWCEKVFLMASPRGVEPLLPP